jgi:hypothetical protein
VVKDACFRASKGRRQDELPDMFAWLAKRRIAKQRQQLERKHLALLTAARDLQRNGDIQGFAARTAEADAAARELEVFDQRHGIGEVQAHG